MFVARDFSIESRGLTQVALSGACDKVNTSAKHRAVKSYFKASVASRNGSESVAKRLVAAYSRGCLAASLRTAG